LLLNSLQIKAEDIEAWAIEAIAHGIIDAKIDQLSETIVIKSHIMQANLKGIQTKIGEWRDRFEKMQHILSYQQSIGKK
jgi:hypothetical protein